ncbi:LamG domain-containing protein, partial [Lentibacter algarum]|uniref:LamG domain-containing protein n=1 Tax=Lentibacter algarum TaxID=576131 RepID=UPI0026F2E5BC
IKGAFLSDTDDTDLVGAELVTNGTFDTDTSGWTSTVSLTWNASGYADIDRAGGGSNGHLSQSISTVVGKSYTITFDIVALSHQVNFDQDGAERGVFTTTGTKSVTFTAVLASTGIDISATNDLNATASIDNVSVKLADADRSVNNNGLIVNGTVTRSPVATGADLVAYSGFSASNYLEQPYNSDLDFGTGDFCVMGWMKGTDASGKLFVRHEGSSSTDRIIVDVASGGKIRFYVDVASGLVTSTSLVTTNQWVFVCGVRVGTILYVYINGNLEASVTHAVNGYDLSNANAKLHIGEHPDLPDPYGGSLALWRISATAPTASQIEKIYNDEKVLFQENAQATLYGTSDAVKALAHDDDTNLLHVGTSAGRSVFQGLRRVENTTTAVGTAISASNGLVVEE